MQNWTDPGVANPGVANPGVVNPGVVDTVVMDPGVEIFEARAREYRRGRYLNRVRSSRHHLQLHHYHDPRARRARHGRRGHHVHHARYHQRVAALRILTNGALEMFLLSQL